MINATTDRELPSMSTDMTRRLPRIAALACLVGITVLSAACGTKGAADPLSPSGAQGRLRFVNLITDTTRGRVNAILESLPFGVNITYTLATPATLPSPATALYSPILAGARMLVLKRTADTNTTVATIPVTITAGSADRIYRAILSVGDRHWDRRDGRVRVRGSL